MNLREDEIVVLTKACYGSIDAPRRWWKSLVRDTQQLGWRSCQHEPCLMTWHVRGRLKGLMCFHVDDIMISSPRDDPEFKRMMDKVKRLYEWCEWERNEFDSVAAEYVRQQTSRSRLIKRATPESTSLITMSAHRRKHMSETLVSGRTHNIDGKTWRAGLVSNTIHDSTVGTTESYRQVENSNWAGPQGLELTRATGAL